MNDELNSGDDTKHSDADTKNSEAVTKDSRSFKIFMAVFIFAMIALVAFAWISDEHEKQVHKAAASSLSNPEIYQSAWDRSDTVNDAYWQLNDLVLAFIRAMNDDTIDIVDSDVQQLKSDVEAFEDANAQFGKLRAMGNADVKEAYTSYMDRAESYATFANKLADSALPLAQAVDSCSDEPESYEAYDDAFYTKYEDYVKSCKSDLDALKDAPDPTASHYASSMGDYVDTNGSIIGQMKAIGTDDAVKYDTPEYTQFWDLASKLHEQDSLFVANYDVYKSLSREADDADPGDDLSDLRDLLLEKSRG